MIVRRVERDDVPFDQFAVDLAGPSESFPAFALITPDICNDMHDCPVATGDNWLRTNVEPILSSTLYKAGRTAVFVVFDESEGAADAVHCDRSVGGIRDGRDGNTGPLLAVAFHGGSTRHQ